MKFITLLLLCLWMSSVSVFADGTESSGGGDLVIINGEQKILDLAEKESFMPENSVYFEKWLKPRLLKLEKSYLDLHIKYHSSDRGMFYPHNFLNESLQNLHWYFTSSDLPEINDEGSDSYKIELQGEKKQLALQVRDTVYIQKKLFDSLPDEQKAALVLHELTLNAVIKLTPSALKDAGTSKVRSFVSFIFMKDFEKFQSEKVINAFRRIGIRVPEGAESDWEIALESAVWRTNMKILGASEFLDIKFNFYELKGDELLVKNDLLRKLDQLQKDDFFKNELNTEFLAFMSLVRENQHMIERDDLAYFQEKCKFEYDMLVIKAATNYNNSNVFSKIGNGFSPQKVDKDLVEKVVAINTLKLIQKRLNEELAEKNRKEKFFTKVYLE